MANGSSTPTRAAENAAVTYLTQLAMTDQNPKFIVLATDGQPNCPASGSQSADDSPGAITAVTNAANGRLSRRSSSASPPPAARPRRR